MLTVGLMGLMVRQSTSRSSERPAVSTPAAGQCRAIRRSRRIGTLVACVALAAGTAPPVASAAARDQLAQAIQATRGNFLVYNFGPESPAPMLNAAGSWYEMGDGGHLMILKSAARKLAPRLLVDTHQGFQARCEQTPGARTQDGLIQAAEIYSPVQAWGVLGRPRIAVNANFFDVRRQEAGRWKQTGCTSPLGAYVDNTGNLGRANVALTGTVPYAGKQALSNGDEIWTPLSTLILPVASAPYVITPNGPSDFDSASSEIARLMGNGTRFVAVSGLKLLSPGDTGQLNDPGPRAARTALAYNREQDEFYVFQGGDYTPTRYRTCSAAWAVTPPSSLTAAVPQHWWSGEIPVACGPGQDRRAVPATPSRCSATRTNGRYRPGLGSTELRYSFGVRSSEVTVVILVTSQWVPFRFRSSR